MTDAIHRVLEKVAAAKDVSPMELDPLYDVIDPDALDALFESSPPEQRLSVQFQYEGFIVTITGAGNVELTELPNPTSSDCVGGVN